MTTVPDPPDVDARDECLECGTLLRQDEVDVCWACQRAFIEESRSNIGPDEEVDPL